MSYGSIISQYEDLYETVRLEIGEHWTASDLSDLIGYVDDLYNIRLFIGYAKEAPEVASRSGYFRDRLIEVLRRYVMETGEFVDLQEDDPERALYHGPVFRQHLKSATDSRGAVVFDLGGNVRPYESLVVRRITYASPGIADLAGLGEVVKQIKEFLLEIMRYVGDRDLRKTENEKRRAEVAKARIEAAKNFVSLAKDVGYSDENSSKS